MDAILDWGLDVVRLAQKAKSPALTAAMQGLSFLGSEWFFLAALPFVYWCVDKRRGLRLGILVFLSTFSNLALKKAFGQPRPFHLDPSVKLADETTNGLPSNHAQIAATFWGKAAPLFPRRLGAALALALPLLIGLSRIYLGVHFPTDVLAGWVLGALFVLGDSALGDRLEAAILPLRPPVKLALAAAVSLGMNALDMTDTMISGAFFGISIGLIYGPKAAPFSCSGAMRDRILRYLAGMACTLVLYFGLKLLAGGLGRGDEPLMRFARYLVLGSWVSLGAPWLFLKLGLAGREVEAGLSPRA
jgi:hypothetical protein